MQPNQDPIIGLCWATFAVVWIGAAFWAKPTTLRAPDWSRWSVWAVGFVIVAYLNAPHLSGDVRLWRYSPTLRVAADVVVVVGLMVTLWARTILAGNWSAGVVIKEHHELVARGPYAIVRHPIYTGTMIMVLGMTMLWGTLVGVVLWLFCALALWVKAGLEERLLTEHFPSEYRAYQCHVRARLIPFVM